MIDGVKGKRLGIGVAALAWALLATARPGWSQDREAPSRVSQSFVQQAAAVGIDEVTLDRYAESLAAIQRIQLRVAQELHGVVDEQEAYDIEERAKEEMIEAVMKTGISVEDYQRVSQLMNALPEVREVVMERVMEWLDGSV